jgi:hypothetical protein
MFPRGIEHTDPPPSAVATMFSSLGPTAFTFIPIPSYIYLLPFLSTPAHGDECGHGKFSPSRRRHRGKFGQLDTPSRPRMDPLRTAASSLDLAAAVPSSTPMPSSASLRAQPCSPDILPCSKILPAAVDVALDGQRHCSKREPMMLPNKERRCYI